MVGDHTQDVPGDERDAAAFVRLVAMLPSYRNVCNHDQEAQDWLARAATARGGDGPGLSPVGGGLSRFQVLRGGLG